MERSRLFQFLLEATVALSAFDAGMAVYWIHVIHEYNPVCDMLLKAGSGWFLASKACGTLGAVAGVCLLRSFREWAGWLAAWTISAFMAGVAAYQVLP